MSTLDSACSRKRKLTADVNEPTYIQEEEANHDSPRRKIRRRENSTELWKPLPSRDTQEAAPSSSKDHTCQIFS